MGILNYSVKKILRDIPKEVLFEAFKVDADPATFNLTTLDFKIIQEIIRDTVIVDADIVGGTDIMIPLGGLTPERHTPYTTIYKIPDDFLADRNLVSVGRLLIIPTMEGNLGVAPGHITALGNSSYGMYQNPLMSVANRIGNSAQPNITLNNASLTNLGNNCVAINMHYTMLANVGMECTVSNDENLNNIQPRNWEAFSKLCILAAKAYVYVKLITPLNMGKLEGGEEIGIIKSIVESYESANEDYRVYLNEVWRKIAHMNDTNKYEAFIRSMIAPDL